MRQRKSESQIRAEVRRNVAALKDYYRRMREQGVTEVKGAEPRFNENGEVIVDLMTCGTCGRTWNDAAVSSVTPTPSARCPFEYEHETNED